MHLCHRVGEGESGLTLRTLLCRELRFSTAMIQKLKATDGVRVNEKMRRMNEKLSAGDEVRVTFPPEPPTDAPVETGPLAVLYLDDFLLAAEKPPGMLTHPSLKQHRGTLVSRGLGYLASIGQTPVLHSVNRLDRDTSGIVLFARHGFAHAHLMAQMKEGSVVKRYEALVVGRMPRCTGEIRLPIGRAPDSYLTRRIDEGGQAAHTRYAVREVFHIRGATVSRVDLWPITGRTHQLRLHCLSVGAPLLGDTQYLTPASQALSRQLGLDGQLLHAASLSFVHPADGRPVEIHCPMTRDAQ